MNHNHEDYSSEYMKFAGIVAGIAAISFYLYVAFGSGALTDYVRFFMGIFLIVFATFKFINLEDFPDLFARYDVIAEKFIAYGYLYPFIQLGLGSLYLADAGGTIRDLIMLVVASVSAYGVIKAMRTDDEEIQCACLGNVIELPLSKISLIEDAGMAIMAAIMLFM